MAETADSVLAWVTVLFQEGSCESLFSKGHWAAVKKTPDSRIINSELSAKVYRKEP